MAQKATPSVQHQTPAVNPSSGSQIPFRAATIERIDTLTSFGPAAMTASTQRVDSQVEGAGMVYGIYLDVQATVATSTAASVAVYAEDAPFNVLDNVVFRDVNGEICDLQGYHLYVAHLMNGWTKSAPAVGNAPGAALPATTGAGGVGTAASQDTSTTQNVGVIGSLSTTAAAGGNFRFGLRVPVATNRRDLLGILGNQDRAQKFSLRTDIAASGAVFSTAPSSLPNITINKFYEQYAVPLPNGPDGTPQEQFPANYGTVLYHTQTVSEGAPTNGGQVPHFVRRIGNTVRWMGLAFRSTTVASGTPLRGNADANPPTQIQLKVGEDSIISENWTYRKALMFERYGFDMPLGLLAYDWIHDAGPFSGYELGDDLIHSQALVNASFKVSYPTTANTWKGGSTLTFITSDLIFSEPQVVNVA